MGTDPIQNRGQSPIFPSGSPSAGNRALTPIFEKAFGYLAAVFLAAMMLVTVADVALRAVFNRPIHGTFELIELCLACTIFVALPAVFLRDEHLVVDVVDHLAPPAVVKLLDLFVAVASLSVLSLVFWLLVPLVRVSSGVCSSID